ncbi:luciferase family protein [Halorarius litoreus]|uniref:luciferase domain-containing protein n=1 Tax=Halorarius litoreus TaxID=2962676 RepID=UPI0020CC34AD|nr:luciferase family protein [Halorarius litoreus]
MTSREAIRATVERLIDTVETWEGVTVGDHRFGGTEFRVGPREIGHVHEWGMLDIAYFRPLRDTLVEAGETGIHHLLTESGWTTYYIESPDDFAHAEWLLRLSYLYHVAAVKKTPAGAEELAAVDVDVEIAEMDLPEPILAAFERRATA